MDSTVKTGPKLGDLMKVPKTILKLTINRMMFERLLEAKVGTWEIESNALDLNLKRKKNWEEQKENGKKIERIRKFRNWETVKDLIELKLKYCKEEETKEREEYAKVKKRLKEEHRKNKRKKSEYRQTIKRITKLTTERLKKGMEKIKKKD